MRFRKYRIKCFGRYDPLALQCKIGCSRAGKCRAASEAAGVRPE
jgi:hypothetical protein